MWYLYRCMLCNHLQKSHHYTFRYLVSCKVHKEQVCWRGVQQEKYKLENLKIVKSWIGSLLHYVLYVRLVNLIVCFNHFMFIILLTRIIKNKHYTGYQQLIHLLKRGEEVVMW